jgi:putative transposase
MGSNEIIFFQKEWDLPILRIIPQKLIKKGGPIMKIDFYLYRAQRRRIERRFKKSKDKIEVLRCRILLLLHRKMKVFHISNFLGCVRATVYRTLYRFQEMGEFGLVDQRTFGEPSKVTPSIKKALLSYIEKSPRDYKWQRCTWTLELLSLQIENDFGVKLSLSHIRTILISKGCRKGRPRVALRIPIRGRKLILRAISRIISKASFKDEVFYSDEADIDLNPRIGFMYMKKGHQPLVLTPGKNEKRYIAGAVNSRTGKIVYTTSQNKNSRLFISLLQKLSTLYRHSKRIHLILDNYIIHKSQITKRFLKKYCKRIKLHFLPPYSPESNTIERLWKQLHDQVTRNHQFKTIEELLDAARQFLKFAQPFPGNHVSIAKI